VDLQERLEGYQVTSLPRRPPLRLLWSPAEDGGDEDAATMQDCPALPLAILVSYRITQVPVRAAS